jgi:hypothetical protein
VDRPEDDAARQAAMEKLVPALDPSEYGQMPPSYYTNSQRVAPHRPMADEKLEELDGFKASPPRTESIRPILMRDRYDGVDSDDTDEDEERQIRR